MKKKCKLFGITLLLLILSTLGLVTPLAKGQSNINLNQIFQWPYGETGKIIHDGPYTYLCSGASVLCFQKVGNDFRLVHLLSAPSLVKDIALNDKFLCLATQNDGLIIYRRDDYFQAVHKLFPEKEITDITLTDEIILLSASFEGLFGLYCEDWEEFFHLPTKNIIWKTLYHNGILYAIDGLANKNLFVIKLPIPEREDDIESPSEIVDDWALADLIASIEQLNDPEGHRLLSEEGKVMEISEEDEDSIIEMLKKQPRHLTTINRGNEISDIAINGNSLYIADGLGGLAIYNIYNPEKITFRKSFTPRDISERYPTQGLEETQYNKIEISNNLLFASGTQELHIFSIQNNTLNFLSKYNSPSQALALAPTPPNNVSYHSDFLTLADKHGLASFIKYDQPNNFLKLRDMQFPSDVTCFALDEDRIFLGSEYGELWEISLNYQGSPLSIVKLSIPGLIQDMYLENNYIYIATGIGLGAVNISRANNPTLISFIPFPYPHNRPNINYGWVEGVTFYNGHVYAAAGSGGLWVVDFSQPHFPRTISLLAMDSNIHKTSLDPLNKRIYAFGEPTSGIFSATSSTVYGPALLKRLDTKNCNGVGLASGRHLYLGLQGTTSESATIEIYDVFSPYSPSLLTKIELPRTEITDIALVGTLLAVSSDMEIYIYDISSLSRPNLVKTILSPGKATKLETAHDRLAISSYNAGSIVFRLSFQDWLWGGY